MNRKLFNFISMRPRTAQFLAISLVAAVSGCDRAPAPPSTSPARQQSALTYESKGVELGVVPWPEGTDTKFKFKNTGLRTVKIIDFFANCGCSNPRLRIIHKDRVVREGFGRGETTGPLLVVEPGEEGEMAVRFETRGLTGEAKEHYSMISVVTDEQNVEPTGLFIKATIERKYELSPTQVAFEPMGAKQEQVKEAKLFLLTPGAAAPFDAKVVSAPPFLRVALSDQLLGLRPYVAIGMIAGPGLKKETNQGEIIIEGKFGKPKSDEIVKITIPVFVPVVGDIQMKPGVLDFQVVDPGKPAKTAAVNIQFLDPESKLTLGTPVIEGDSAELLKLQIEPETKGPGYQVTLVAEKGFPSISPSGAHGLVRIPTNQADLKEIRLPWRALARPVPSK